MDVPVDIFDIQLRWNTSLLILLILMHLRCFNLNKNSHNLCTFSMQNFWQIRLCKIFDKSHVWQSGKRDT